MTALAAIFGFLANHWKATALVLAVGVPIALAGYWHALYTHEREAGAKERIALAAEVIKVTAENKRRLDDAQTTIDGLRALLKAPAPPDPRGPLKLVCRAPRQVAAVPKDASPSPGGDAAAGPPAGVAGPDADIVPPTEAILTEARNRILYLQGYVRACQQNGFCATKAN